jgi:[protein-PII] uridylyltransferase
MSATAFKRDLTDPKTIENFVGEVQSLERLRNLMILTAVDIRAVGPGTWNSWKGQLLGDLYDAAQERLRLGHMKHGRQQRIAAKQEAVVALLGDKAHLKEDVGSLLDDSYWIAEHEDMITSNLIQYEIARKNEEQLSIHCEFDATRGATLVSVIAADHPGLFFRIAGGIALAGANIIDARIHTTRTGYAVDNFLVQDPHGQPFAEGQQLERLKRSIRDALANRVDLVPKLAARPLPITRSSAFRIAPRVTFDNNASGRFTVIEVNARDRPALLNRLARALFESKLVIQSAHVTAYGERAADTFYVTDLLGAKITADDRLKEISDRLLHAASDARQKQLEEA